MNFKDIFKKKQDRKASDAEVTKFAAAAKEFSDKYPEALVILGDPHTDVIFMTHQYVTCPVKITNADGTRNFIVSNALKHKRGQGDIDRFLLAVDGGLFAIANALYTQRRGLAKMADWLVGSEPPAQSAEKLTDGSTLSPIQIKK